MALCGDEKVGDYFITPRLMDITNCAAHAGESSGGKDVTSIGPFPEMVVGLVR